MIKNNLEKEINRYKLKTTGASLNSRLKMLLLVVGASTTIGLLIVLGLLWTMPPLPKREITDEICLSDISGQLVCGKTEYRLYEYTKERIDNEIDRLTVEYENRVQEVNDESNTDNVEHVTENFFDRKPAARIVTDSPHRRKRAEERDTMITINGWETGKALTDDGGFMRFGMQFIDGRIMVPLTGIYAVSSYVEMVPRPNTSDQSVGHAIFKYNTVENREVKLVSNQQPKQNCTWVNSNKQSSFLNTIVGLTSGEELSVKSSGNVDLRVTPKLPSCVFALKVDT